MSSPSLVGGIPLRAFDLPGGIVFAAAYGLLVSAFAYRLFDRRWRTLFLYQFTPSAIERCVLFSLRAAVAAGSIKESTSLRQYQQVTFALGYLSLANTVCKFMRSVLVNSTKGVEATSELSSLDVTSSQQERGLVADLDDPRRRYRFRRWAECLDLLFFAALITGIIATAHLYAPADSAANKRTQGLRYASAASGLVLVLSMTATLLWAQRNVPRIDRQATRMLLTMTLLLTFPPIYRLVVMHSTTPDIADRDSQSQNALADKATFYIIHILPEWIVVAMACAFNMKEICATGFFGDWRSRDETPEERAKRERKDRGRP